MPILSTNINASDMSKKELIYALENLPEEERLTLFPFPRFRWDFKLPDTLMTCIKHLSTTHNNCAGMSGFFTFNTVTLNTTTGLIGIVEYKKYWKTLPVFDLRQAANGRTFTGSYTPTYIKPGKFIKQLFPTTTPQECEAFTNTCKQYILQHSPMAVKEDVDILHAYHMNNTSTGGSIGGSCMRYIACLPRIDFYRRIGLRIATFTDPLTGLIRSRALVWPNMQVTRGGQTTTETFLDRIYYSTEEDLNRMIAYAEMKGYVYRQKQSAGTTSYMRQNGEDFHAHLSYPVSLPHLEAFFPYIDTMTFVYYDTDGRYSLRNYTSSSGSLLGQLQELSEHHYIRRISFVYEGMEYPYIMNDGKEYLPGEVSVDISDPSYPLIFHDKKRNDRLKYGYEGAEDEDE